MWAISAAEAPAAVDSSSNVVYVRGASCHGGPWPSLIKEREFAPALSFGSALPEWLSTTGETGALTDAKNKRTKRWT